MNKVVLTGASSGIGASILSQLIENNTWDILTVSRRHPSPPGKYRHISCDLSDMPSVERLSQTLQKEFTAPFLINCAGVGRFGPTENFPLPQWNEIIALNLTTPFMLMQALLPSMKAAKFGRIIHIGSDAGHQGFPEAAAYCAAKHGLRGCTEALRKELIGTGVSVTLISPGRVDTCFNAKKIGDRPSSLSASDVADAAMYILHTNPRCEVEDIRLKSNLE